MWPTKRSIYSEIVLRSGAMPVFRLFLSAALRQSVARGGSTIKAQTRPLKVCRQSGRAELRRSRDALARRHSDEALQSTGHVDRVHTATRLRRKNLRVSRWRQLILRVGTGIISSNKRRARVLVSRTSGQGHGALALGHRCTRPVRIFRRRPPRVARNRPAAPQVPPRRPAAPGSTALYATRLE